MIHSVVASAPLILVAASILLSLPMRFGSARLRSDSGTVVASPPARWSGLWRIAVLMVLAAPVELFALIIAGFVGHDYIWAYVLVEIVLVVAFAPLSFSRMIGPLTRRLVIGVLILGSLLWLAGWHSFLQDQGWQF